MSKRALIYARISLDRSEGEGVARQVADCRDLAASRGFEVVGEYVDNDVSAYRKKRRPEWGRLVADLPSVDALIAYHPDRLYRRTRDLEDLIDALEGHSVEVVTVQAGELDLASASGRMVARMLGAAARHESERISERVTRVKKQRAAEGKPTGGGRRAFGWKADGMALEPAEARALKAAAEAVAAGGSIGAEAARLREQGFTTTGGGKWTSKDLARVLKSARIAGLREYRGQVVGPAQWTGIVDELTWKRIRLMIEGRRIGTRTLPRALLSGLISCPKCDKPLYSSRGRGGYASYACAPGTRLGCGGSSIGIDYADAKVSQVVGEWLDDPNVPAWLVDVPTLDLSGEFEAIERKQVDLARRWAQGTIPDVAYDEARAVLAERLEALGDAPPVVASVTLTELRHAWTAGEPGDRRAVIEALVEAITLTPGRMANPGDRLTVHFRDM